MFVGMHAMAAQALKSPELMLTDDEGKMFAKSCQDVMRHYSVQTTQKTLDWVALMGVSAGIYGPRAYAIMARLREERENGGRPVQRGQVVRPDRFQRQPRGEAVKTDPILGAEIDYTQPGFDGAS